MEDGDGGGGGRCASWRSARIYGGWYLSSHGNPKRSSGQASALLGLNPIKNRWERKKKKKILEWMKWRLATRWSVLMYVSTKLVDPSDPIGPPNCLGQHPLHRPLKNLHQLNASSSLAGSLSSRLLAGSPTHSLNLFLFFFLISFSPSSSSPI